MTGTDCRPGFLSAMVAGVASLLSGCVTGPAVSHGDAVRHGEIGSPLTNFSIPEFSIGQKGTHEFTIENLTARAYPVTLRIHTREWDSTGFFGYTWWEEARFRIEILDADSGGVLRAVTFRPRLHRQVGAGRYDHMFFPRTGPDLGFRENYRVRVTVLEPSPRKWDRAELLLR